MNWYTIFYWLTVADGVKSFFDGASNIFTWFAVISSIVFVVTTITKGSFIASNDGDDAINAVGVWVKSFKAIMITSIVFAMITWAGYVFTPSKKDALIIIAGGTVGNFVTQDSSARKIPSEVLMMLRNKIKEESDNTSLRDLVGGQVDTLKNKTPEELRAIIRNQTRQ